ncbi:hypothetical protein AeRB84_005198 [Aphanomyces euteiches]|nr:hypothetical protein AeRB84_005198 [Aphanomyces euteiches]
MDEEQLLAFALSAYAHESQRINKAIHIPAARFNLKAQSDSTCEHHFRFARDEIMELAVALEIPDPLCTRHRYSATKEEALCIMLNKFAWPHRLGSMVLLFGRSREALSEISNAVVDHIYEKFGSLLYWDERRLDPTWMESCSKAIHDKGAPLDSCIGFIDGTVAYNGHKRKHALKFQSICSPDGIIVHLHGPELGSRHDAYLLERSQIVPYLKNKLLANNKRYVVYGDPAYGINDVIISGFKGARLDQFEAEFNKRMSAVRVSVEWGFGIVLKLWTMVDYKGGQKIWSRAVGKQYAVAVILTNLHTCVKKRNQISSYFGVNPPDLQSYITSAVSVQQH